MALDRLENEIVQAPEFLDIHINESGNCLWRAMEGHTFTRDSMFEFVTTCIDTAYYPDYNEALVDWLNANEVAISIEFTPTTLTSSTSAVLHTEHGIPVATSLMLLPRPPRFLHAEYVGEYVPIPYIPAWEGISIASGKIRSISDVYPTSADFA